MPKNDDELNQRAEEMLTRAVKILREDGLIKNVNAIKKHLNIQDEEPTDPDAPPKPPKKEKEDDKQPANDPPADDPPAKRRHWLYGEIDE